MANIEKINNDLTEFIELLHNKDNITPFVEDIFLLSVHVAGLYFIENIEAIFPKIEKGSELELIREKNNKYDKFAILVKFDGEKIGYVPRKENKILANLMDGGKQLYGIVESASKETVYIDDENYFVKFKIFLKE